MSLPTIIIVDIQHDNKEIDIEDLTQTALDSLIFECEWLSEKLKDAAASTED